MKASDNERDCMRIVSRIPRWVDGLALLVGSVAVLNVVLWFGALHYVAADYEHESRSPQWPKVRDKFIAAHPECAACGSKGKPGKPLQCHHLIPISVDANGDVDHDGVPNELDGDNLITLCVEGVGNSNCHLLIGHAGNFRCHNENCRRDAKRFREMLESKVCAYRGDVTRPPRRRRDRRSRRLAC